MRKATWLAIGVLALGSLCSFAAGAQDERALEQMSPEAQAALREHWESMTPEEQEDLVQRAKERKAKLESLSPEQQAALQQRRDERRKEWAGMSEEEKRAAIAEYRQKKETAKARWDSMSEEERAAAKERMKERQAGD